MIDYKLIAYNEEINPIWDSCVRTSKNGNFLHQRRYMGYHAHRFDERSVIVLRKGKPVAVFPCNLVGDTLISHGGLTYGGLIYGIELHAAEVLEIFQLLVEHYQRSGVSRLRYKAIPHIFHRYPAEEDLYALYRLGASLVRRDLSSAISMQEWPGLSDLRKRKVRRAAKHGVEFVIDANLSQFHALLEDVLAKFHTKPVHTLAELELLQSRFPQHIRLYGASRAGKLLAGALVYDFGHVVHTQYLASSEEGRAVGALDYVLAHLVEKVYADRKYLSFGISTEQEGHYLNEGLIFQKEGFGGRGVVHDHYEVML